MSKVRMGLAGGLASLTAGSVGAYLGLDGSDDPISKVLSLDSHRTTKNGRCRIRVNLGSGNEENEKEYGEFYKQSGDSKGVVASYCLKRLSEVDKEKEDAVVVLERGVMVLLLLRNLKQR
ncbi:hypothetical protein MHF_0199 [Mycoplasma haemofelis Ohio2]|uniref:Uncharacterized protein n=1 Tax=Mycoplasma haemofelis (strain Ohio2) TaxID=859194 RepID=F6FGA8_MYCHI|nr:hypothetical protein MHF_0199 [Mycoplasma haemofelis Ohio2]